MKCFYQVLVNGFPKFFFNNKEDALKKFRSVCSSAPWCIIELSCNGCIIRSTLL